MSSIEKDFRIHIAGPPYVVEMIRRSLAHDFRYFSLAAFVLFGLTMAALFRSVRVFLGMLATCTSAVLLTLLLQSFFGQKIGILTVNLGTIVFIIALSHLVYMTFNWQTLARRMGKSHPELAAAARSHDISRFLLVDDLRVARLCQFVNCQAKPLRELGFGGVLGTVVAFVCAYLMYPAFLRWAVPRKTKLMAKEPSRAFLVAPFRAALARHDFARRRPRLWPHPNKHRSESPRLFQAAPELRDGLEYVDAYGGANPLTLVVSAADGSQLNTDEAYKKMWTLHSALEQNDKDVGTVISLPTFSSRKAIGRRSHFSSVTKQIMRTWSKPEHARIARKFR